VNIHNNMANRNSMKDSMKNSTNILKFMQTTKVTTTSEIAEKIGLAWNTAEKRLLELALESKIERIKKAGVNLWVLK